MKVKRPVVRNTKIIMKYDGSDTWFANFSFGWEGTSEKEETQIDDFGFLIYITGEIKIFFFC